MKIAQTAAATAMLMTRVVVRHVLRAVLAWVQHPCAPHQATLSVNRALMAVPTAPLMIRAVARLVPHARQAPGQHLYARYSNT